MASGTKASRRVGWINLVEELYQGCVLRGRIVIKFNMDWSTKETITPKVGRWSPQEHMVFLLALSEFGKNWKEVQKRVPSRSLKQIHSHAQKYFKRETERVHLRKLPQLYHAWSGEESLKKYLQFLDALQAYPSEWYYLYYQMMYKAQSTLVHGNNAVFHPEKTETLPRDIRIE